jgi:alkanesulfonate monooxygenase SsuD/methylene tetrahydromethanopterin reductase-like flavin-dependent oxidoreductase (luciferase family)
MRLGILVESEDGLTWEQWRRTVGSAEQLGFDSVWISDHLLSSDGQDRGGLDAWLALSLAAASSHSLQLGPLVTPITFRSAGLLARMALNLHTLSQGRFVLGLGMGWNAREHATFGIPFPPGPERLHLLESGLALIRRTLKQRVPILIGGSGRGTLRLVARYADEWNVTTSSPDLHRGLSQTLTQACQVIGRDPASVRRSVAVGVLIGRDTHELCARAERLRGVVPGLAEVPTEQVVSHLREQGWVVGTPDEIVAALNALAQVGLQRAMLGHYDQDDTAALELIAAEVLPWI